MTNLEAYSAGLLHNKILYTFLMSSCGLRSFREKVKVEIHFLEQVYIKGMSWHKIKPCGKTTGSKQQHQIVTSNTFQTTKGEQAHGYTSQIHLWRENQDQILHVFEIQSKSCRAVNWRIGTMLLFPSLCQLCCLFFPQIKLMWHDGKHGNADMLWVVNV